MSVPNLETLQRAIERELANERHSSRVHGRRGTYVAGCRGPLCRKANRDYMRTWIDSEAPRGPLVASDRDALMAEYITRLNAPLDQPA